MAATTYDTEQRPLALRLWGRVAFLFVFMFLATLCACNKELVNEHLIDDQTVHQNTVVKDRLKTTELYASLLHSCLFEQPIAANLLPDIVCLMSGIGGEQLSNEFLLQHYLNSPALMMPTEVVMRSHIPNFVTDTYTRFLLRQPTPAELEWWVKYIENHISLTPDMVYHAFAMCGEYRFY